MATTLRTLRFFKMSYQPSSLNPPVPTISVPTPTDSPSRTRSPDLHNSPPTNSSSRTPFRTPMRANSGDLFSTPLTIPNTPRYFRTPSHLDSQAASRVHPKPEAPSYFERSFRSSTRGRATQVTSPSDNLSTPPCWSPSLGSHSSGGGSFYSSDSGALLTPPLDMPDFENPPYKPRRQSSESLTMVRRSKRSGTVPQDGDQKSRRRHRRKHKFRNEHSKGAVEMDEHRSQAYWWLPARQIVPTAPAGMQQLCAGHKHRTIKAMRKHIIKRLMARPTPPVITRRWSSVEIGSDRRSQKVLPKRSITTVLEISPTPVPEDQSAKFSPTPLTQQYQDFTRNVAPHSIVQTVRETLTSREILPEVMAPTTITLRRASRASAMSNVSTGTELISPPRGRSSEEMTPVASFSPSPVTQKRPSTTYLITNKDIDSITELINESFKKKLEHYGRGDAVSRSRDSSIGKKGVVVNTLFAAESSVTIADDSTIPVATFDPMNYLQVTSASHKRPNSLKRQHSSPRSIHEVIWEGGGSLQSGSSMTDEDDRSKNASASNCSPHQGTSSPDPRPEQSASKQLGEQHPRVETGDAFDPKNARASINEWSWRCPLVEQPIIANLSDSESAHDAHCEKSTKKSRQASFVAYASPQPRRLEVISFPPLPRKMTIEWHSPLPDITAPSPSPPPLQRLPRPQSLYDIGIDACIGASEPSPSLGMHKSTEKFDAREPNHTDECSVSESNTHRKSIIKMHPKAPARVGISCTMGCSIGSSSGARKNSKSPPGLKRVTTIDNPHKGEREGPWIKPRQDSSYPTPVDTSLDQEDLDELWSATKPPSRNQTPTPKATGADKRVPSRKSPQLISDFRHIYNKITGSVSAGEPCNLDLKPHECDDCAKDPRTPDEDWIG